MMPNIEDLSDDQYDRDDDHCIADWEVQHRPIRIKNFGFQPIGGLGFAKNQEPNIENLFDGPMIAMMIIALRIGRSSIASNHTTAATGGQQIHHCECYNVLSSSSYCHHHCKCYNVLSSPLRVLQCLVIILTVNDIVIIIATRPKPSYGLTGRIHGPGYSSSGYILRCSQRLASDLQRSTRIRLLMFKFLGKGKSDDFWYLTGGPN